MAVIWTQSGSLLTQHSALSTQHFVSLRPRSSLAVIGVLLIALIGATILLGDRVGVQVVTRSRRSARRTAPARSRIRFSEAMDHDSATAHFQTDPALEGTLSVERLDDDLSIRRRRSSRAAPTPSRSSRARSARADAQLLTSIATASRCAPARRLSLPGGRRAAQYLDRRSRRPRSSAADHRTARPELTISASARTGRRSPSPRRIQRRCRDQRHQADRPASGALEQLTNCQNAVCSAPVWRPDGKMIAYERVEIRPPVRQQPAAHLADRPDHHARDHPPAVSGEPDSRLRGAVVGGRQPDRAGGSRLGRRSSSTTSRPARSSRSPASRARRARFRRMATTLIYPDIVSEPERRVSTSCASSCVDTGEFSR